MAVHKEVTITATSPESWEEAALSAVERTESSVEHSSGPWYGISRSS